MFFLVLSFRFFAFVANVFPFLSVEVCRGCVKLVTLFHPKLLLLFNKKNFPSLLPYPHFAFSPSLLDLIRSPSMFTYLLSFLPLSVLPPPTPSQIYSTHHPPDKDESEIPLPNVKALVLKKVTQYMKYHYDNPPKEIDKPLKSASMNEVVSQWDADFVDVDQELLFELILVCFVLVFYSTFRAGFVQ